MFIGHFGLAMGAKKVNSQISLGTLFMAFQFLDLVWPVMLLSGAEQVAIHPEYTGAIKLEFVHYPFTHSLLGASGWAIGFGGIYWLIKRNLKSAALLALGVVSHWFLDLIVHFPDLPLYPGATVYFGLGGWASTALTVTLELILFVGGIALYLKSVQIKNTTGKVLFWLLIGLLSLIEVSNLVGPPPSSVEVLAWSANLQWILVALAYAVDYNTRTAGEKLHHEYGQSPR
ncbi:metal-dependent hydrolase [Ohtaekwangia sp.]|uniref:metal-dependent hydrolase n=1 Tax=Ohtaekwangia sp. TaxID=2066019 RepID=UPI002FDE139D